MLASGGLSGGRPAPYARAALRAPARQRAARLALAPPSDAPVDISGQQLPVFAVADSGALPHLSVCPAYRRRIGARQAPADGQGAGPPRRNGPLAAGERPTETEQPLERAGRGGVTTDSGADTVLCVWVECWVWLELPTQPCRLGSVPS